ncbi:MAG: glycosyltransferase family 4 protein [Lachnospiraceae bacterium]|nr:glycosyltransferase family 4 protein [Lachnospiraceae bacterium]
MRVLWVCNIMLPAIARELGAAYSVREGWLSGILNRLLQEEDQKSLSLGICFPVEGENASLCKKLYLGEKKREISCYGFGEDLAHPENYDASMEYRFGQILSDFEPDLVHIFGTEFPHAYACAKVWNRPEKTLVGIQGLCCACAEHYMADLPVKVQNSKTLRDILKKDSIKQQQQKFYARAVNEEKLLKLSRHITGRTLFDKTITSQINPDASYHFMNETMRAGFYEGSWKIENCSRYEIFVSQADYPLKGFHYLLQAMKEILQSFPEAHILVAGNSVMGVNGITSKLKIPAYGKYLRRLAKENGLEKKIRVLGRLSEEEMKQAYLSAHVFVCPSSVENSPNSVAEAQLLGTPVVASNAGGIPSIMGDGQGGLLFEKGDVHGLARAVISIFQSDALAVDLSKREKDLAAAKYDGNENYRTLLAIYGELL